MRLNDLLSNTDDQAFWKRYGHLGDAYMTARRKAENTALDLALLSEENAYAQQSTSGAMQVEKGGKFVAVGMWDVRYGVQFFALDYATPEDRADVDEWLKEFA